MRIYFIKIFLKFMLDFQTRLDYTSGDNGNPRIPIRYVLRKSEFKVARIIVEQQ